jgi:hypothetical protein
MRRVWTTGFLLGALLVCGASSAADWKDVKPSRTTEAELIAAFGAPDEIRATFPWSEWSARWRIRPRTTRYVLLYRPDLGAKSALLVGPGGSADGVEVDVSDSIVHGVTWNYGGPSARRAVEMLRADPEMRFNSPESPTYGSKLGPSGRVFAEIGSENTSVRVVYDLK